MAKKTAKQTSKNKQANVAASTSRVVRTRPAKSVKGAAKAAGNAVPVLRKSATKPSKGSAPHPASKSAAKPVKSAAKLVQRTTAPIGGATRVAAEPLAHRLDALLHTMRTISQHEDELCTLLHDARRSGKVNAALLRELQAVLAALPAHEYTDDLDAVLQLTATA